MSSSYTAGLTSVTGTVTTSIVNSGLQSTSVGQTVYYSNSAIASNATTALRTVTAGKTFYLTDITISQNGNGTDGGLFTFRNDSTTIRKVLLSGSASAYFGGQVVELHFNSPIPVVATKVFDVISSGIAGTVNIAYGGFEQ